MSSFARATYGAQDNLHALLTWDGMGTAPSELPGLTDRPPGHIAPGERWWPSLGCGPVGGNRWALWWTEPDRTAQRAGMVWSKAAVWTLEEIGHMEDLQPVVAELSGAPVGPAPEPLLLATLDALVRNHEPVLTELEAWPSVLCAIWRRLWPDARRAFAALVALSPPQITERKPALYIIPANRIPEWRSMNLFGTTSTVTPTRATNWLLGHDDPTITELMHAGILPGQNISFASRLARVAEAVDTMRSVVGQDKLDPAISVLRALDVLAPKPNMGAKVKAEALQTIVEQFPKATLSQLLSLANIRGAALPDGSGLGVAVESWVYSKLQNVNKDEYSIFFRRQTEPAMEPWWHNAILNGLKRGLGELSVAWVPSVWSWLNLTETEQVLDAMLSREESAESRMLAAFPKSISSAAAERGRSLTLTRQWSRLHAELLFQSLPLRDAIMNQRSFPVNAQRGLRELVMKASGPDLVACLIEDPAPELVTLVAERTRQDPSLLQELVPAHMGWLALWRAHIRAGGDPWPPGAERAALANEVLRLLEQGLNLDDLLQPLGSELSKELALRTDRAALWSRMAFEGRRKLQEQVAGLLLQNNLEGPTPEQELWPLIQERMRKDAPSPQTLGTFLSWEYPVSEADLRSWLTGMVRASDGPWMRQIGMAAKKHKWRGVAKELLDLQRRNGAWRPALEICVDLLDWWDRWNLSWSAGEWDQPDSDRRIVEAVAELGAEIAPDGLDHIWTDAGGQRRYLPTGTPNQRWKEAAKLAHHGNLQGGLKALVTALGKEYPNNPKISKILDAFRSREDR